MLSAIRHCCAFTRCSSGFGALASHQQKRARTTSTQQTWSLTQEGRSSLKETWSVSGSAENGFSLERSIEDHREGGAGSSSGPKAVLRNVQAFLRQTFLPAGYPASVSRGYGDYARWQSISNAALQANAVLGSTFLLYSVGLGAGAIPTAGALNWVIKDGLGQLMTLVFGKTIAHNFDLHSKSWYFISILLLQISAGIEILTILAPEYFLVLATIANSIKGLAWMANSSTRSVFVLAFSRDNNIADVTTKATSQYIAASLCGTAAGASLCSVIGTGSGSAMVCYAGLSAASLVAAFCTVKTIPLPTLNTTRLQLLSESFLGAISRAAEARQAQRVARLQSNSIEPPPTDYFAGTEPGVSSSSDSQQGLRRKAIEDDSRRASFSILWGRSQGSASPQRPQGLWGAGARLAGAFEMQEEEEEESSTLSGKGGRGGRAPGAGHGSAVVASLTAGSFERMYDEFLDLQLPTPPELAAEDPPLPFFLGDQRVLNPAIIIGSDLGRVLEGSSPELLVMLLATFRLSRFLVIPRGPAIHIILHVEAGPRDICQAFLQACLIRRRIRAGERLGTAAAEHAVCVIESEEGVYDSWPEPEQGSKKEQVVVMTAVQEHSTQQPHHGSHSQQPLHGGTGQRGAVDQAHLSTSLVTSASGSSQEAVVAGVSQSSSDGSSTVTAIALVQQDAQPATRPQSRLPLITAASLPTPKRQIPNATFPALVSSDDSLQGSGSSSSFNSSSSSSSSSLQTSSSSTGAGDSSEGEQGKWSSELPLRAEAPPLVVSGKTSRRCGPQLAELRIALQDTLQTAERLTSPFMRSLDAAGWRIEKIVIEAEKRRARW